MSDVKKDDRQHVIELVNSAQVAVLTTMTAEGKHVSRPMGLQEAEFDGDLWFSAHQSSAKIKQVHPAREVNVSCSDDEHHSWTSITGRAEVIHDRERAEELYSPALKGWFPDGVETPGIVLTKVVAESAEYWEGPTSTVAFVAGSLRAAVTGNPEQDPITNDTVDL